MIYIPISNVDSVIPLLPDPFVQELFESTSPYPTESRPHLLWFDVHVAALPIVLNRAGETRIKYVANVRVRICDIVVLRA